MGFRFRRSINLGSGFKINLSKSGIGYSWGTKGYRISRTARGTTRRTYSIPGTGISYVDESGGHNRDRIQRSNQDRITQSAQQRLLHATNDHTPERAQENAAISQFKEAKEGTISDALERTIRINLIGFLLLFGLPLVAIHPILALIPVAGVILIVAAHTVGRVSLDYSFDPEKEDEHTRRIDAWQLLAEGEKEWQILSEQLNSNRKTNTGAGRSIKRVTCKIEEGCPYYISTNVNTIQIVLHKGERLIILPDKVFFIQKYKVRMIDYSDFRISTSTIKLEERGKVPKDTQIIGQTWQYINKNGTPDQKVRNNKQIPICLYGQVFLRSSSGWNVELQISSAQNTKDFAELIR